MCLLPHVSCFLETSDTKQTHSPGYVIYHDVVVIGTG